MPFVPWPLAGIIDRNSIYGSIFPFMGKPGHTELGTPHPPPAYGRGDFGPMSKEHRMESTSLGIWTPPTPLPLMAGGDIDTFFQANS